MGATHKGGQIPFRGRIVTIAGAKIAVCEKHLDQGLIVHTDSEGCFVCQLESNFTLVVEKKNHFHTAWIRARDLMPRLVHWLLVHASEVPMSFGLAIEINDLAEFVKKEVR